MKSRWFTSVVLYFFGFSNVIRTSSVQFARLTCWVKLILKGVEVGVIMIGLGRDVI